MQKLIKSIACQNILGEGIIYDWRHNVVMWTDIENKQLFRYTIKQDKLECFATPERLCAFALTSKNNTLLCAFASGFALYNLQTQAIEWLHQPDELQNQGLRLNDGRLDTRGRFWCGAMVENQDICPPEKASLYRLDSDFTLTRIFSNIHISNGICFDASRQTMYFADSKLHQIYRFHYNQKSGDISNKQRLATTDSNHFPDGAVVDTSGHLWSAHWGGSTVNAYNTHGDTVHTAALPVLQPSCVAFGGIDLTTMFVTSAQQGMQAKQLQQYPQSGNVMVLETAIKGVPEPIFNI